MSDAPGSEATTIPPADHELKVWPEYFTALERGEKTFEFRRDDRTPAFQKGDVLRLREWSNDWGRCQSSMCRNSGCMFPQACPGDSRVGYTGRECLRRITYVARGGVIPDGFCVMSIEPLPSSPGISLSEDDAKRIAEIRARLDAATPGPWTYKAEVRRFEDAAHFQIQTVENQPSHPWSPRFIAWMCGARQITAQRFAELNESQQQKLIDDGLRGDRRIEPDAAFIANARADVEWLLARLASRSIETLPADVGTGISEEERRAVDCLLLDFRRACEENAYPAPTPELSVARSGRVNGLWRQLRARLLTARSRSGETTLARERDDARDLCRRWMQAAMFATPVTTLAVDPTNPEAFAESRRHIVDQLAAKAEAYDAAISRSGETTAVAIRKAFLAGAECAVGPERLDPGYDVDAREYAARASRSSEGTDERDLGEQLDALRARNFERINDPRARSAPEGGMTSDDALDHAATIRRYDDAMNSRSATAWLPSWETDEFASADDAQRAADELNAQRVAESASPISPKGGKA